MEAAPGDGADDDQVAEDPERADGAVHEDGDAEREGGAEGGPQDWRAQIDGRPSAAVGRGGSSSYVLLGQASLLRGSVPPNA